jgi:predicted NUDIX family phosphoesterase
LYEINLGILRKKVGVNLRVLEIIGSDLRLRYSTDLGVDSMVSMALKMVKDKIPAGLLEEQPDHVLLVHLGMLDKVRPVFERINVKEVSMLSDNLEIAGDFK